MSPVTMRKDTLIVLLIVTVLAVGAVLAVPRRAEGPGGTDGLPIVAATIFPVYDIARNVAGDAASVRLILPVGASPHTFEPSPSTLRAVSEAEAVYAVGLGLDGWIARLASDTGTDVVEVHHGIALRRTDEQDGDHEDDDEAHGHEGADPHYWLDIANAKRIARNIADDLARRHPELADALDTNLRAYLNELDALDAELRDRLADVPHKGLVTLHDGWYYFAEAYGLEIIATFEPSPGREPTPQYLARLRAAVAESAVSVVYSEPQLSTASLDPFLRDNGLSVAILDPLGSTTHDSYIQLMRDNARTIGDHQR